MRIWSIVRALSAARIPRRPPRSHCAAKTPSDGPLSTFDPPTEAWASSSKSLFNHDMPWTSASDAFLARLRSANSRVRRNMASVVAIVGNAKTTPLAPQTSPKCKAASCAASVLPSPGGAVINSRPAPWTSTGSSRSSEACSGLGGAKPNRSRNAASPSGSARNTARPRPAASTSAGASCTAASQCAFKARSVARHVSSGSRSLMKCSWLASQSAHTTIPVMIAAAALDIRADGVAAAPLPMTDCRISMCARH